MRGKSSFDGTEWRNFHGRVKGKSMNKAQEVRLARDLGALSPGPVSREDNPERAPLDLKARFGDCPIWLEVGFGGGEHLVHMAALNPDVTIIGSEPYINGVAMLLGKIEAAGVTNVSVYPADVRDLFDVLPDACISKAFLNYPDPWPKARHHKRRFVTQGYLKELRRVLVTGSEFRVSTDIPDYVRQTMEEVPEAGFAHVSGPHVAPWDDWISTRYEQKALREGRDPHYLTYRAV